MLTQKDIGRLASTSLIIGISTALVALALSPPAQLFAS